MTQNEVLQQRLIIFAVSLIVIAIELALMRELALRFWEHLGWLVISVALLGFGTSGTVLVLVHRYCRIRRNTLQFYSLLCLALSIPISLRLADLIDFNLIQMVWQPALVWQLGALELVLGIPFVFAGMYIGLALEDSAERVAGNYGASFLGSGAGGPVAILLLYIASPRQLILFAGCIILAMALLHAKTFLPRLCWGLSWPVMAITIALTPGASKIADDKDLPQIQAMEQSTILINRATPQGLFTLVDAPSLHLAPGLALSAPAEVPPQYPFLLDGQIAGSFYLSNAPEDFEFLDYTTMALPYHLISSPKVLIARDLGSDHTGLAVYHQSSEITVLSASDSINRIKLSKIKKYRGYPYSLQDVLSQTATLRGFLQTSSSRFSLIVLPTVGSDPGGLSATQAESTLTIETLEISLNRLTEDGLLAVTTIVQSPPRESLRLLNMLIEVIHKRGGDPQKQITMIRSWATATLVAAKKPLTARQYENIHTFCSKRSFDVAWLFELHPDKINTHHQLESPVYHQGAQKLMGPDREAFIRDYLYDLSVPDDNRPFFNRFGRWQGLSTLTEQIGKRGRAYLEVGSFMLVAALVQTVFFAFFFILAPLAPVVGLPGRRVEQLTVLLFFTTLGLGFMFIEMGFLQRLTVYLAHPLWAAATVLSGVLFFGGIGSSLSGRFVLWLRKKHFQLGMSLVLTGTTLLFIIDPVLDATEKYSVIARVSAAVALIAPLATLMGMLFPIGIKRLSANQPLLIPWAWAINGFASVLATLTAPIFAMQWGFTTLSAIGLSCYAIAAFSSLRLPHS